jgi:transcription antitermination factor NusG
MVRAGLIDRGIIVGEVEARGWAVVVAEAGREEVAERHVQPLGYEIDFLWWRKLQRDRRVKEDGRIISRISSQVVRRPLFPGYGFVLIEHGIDACDIDAAIGVSRLLRHAPADGYRVGRPKIVRASIVEGLRATCAAGEFDSPELQPKPKLRTDLTPGAQVRMPGRTGAMVATIKSLDEQGRAEYFVSLLGRDVPGRFTRAETAHLELVDA